MKRCIVCGRGFSAEHLLTVVVDPRDLKKSIKPSSICQDCYDESGISSMQKVDRVGDHASAFVPRSEQSLV